MCEHMPFSLMPYIMYWASLHIHFKFQGDTCSVKDVMNTNQRQSPFRICRFMRLTQTIMELIHFNKDVFCVRKQFPLVYNIVYINCDINWMYYFLMCCSGFYLDKSHRCHQCNGKFNQGDGQMSTHWRTTASN